MNKRVFRISFIILIIFLLQDAYHYKAEGYGSATHIYVGNRVMDDIQDGKIQLPENVKQAILNNPDNFRAGTIGPDMLDDKLSHNEDAAGIGQRLLELANKSGDPKDIAYAYGYLVHMGGDIDGHPLVNTYTGGISYDYNQGMRPYVFGENPNYSHIYSEGEIDKIIWSKMPQNERDNINQMLSAGTHGLPQLGNYTRPEIMAQAVNKPGVDKDNVYAQFSKPIKGHNAEYLQSPVSSIHSATGGINPFGDSNPFADPKNIQEVLDNVKSAVKTSGNLLQNPNDKAFINLDDGTSLSNKAIKDFFTSRSDRPDGGIDPKFLDSNGNISQKNQETLIRLIREKYPDILSQPPGMQEKILSVMGNREGVADQVIDVLKQDDIVRGTVRTDEYYNGLKQNLLSDPIKLAQASDRFLGKPLPAVSLQPGTLPSGINLPPTVIDASTGYQGAEQTTREGIRDTQQMSTTGTRDTQQMTREGTSATQQMTQDGTRSTTQMSQEGQSSVEQMKQEGTGDIQELYRGIGF